MNSLNSRHRRASQPASLYSYSGGGSSACNGSAVTVLPQQTATDAAAAESVSVSLAQRRPDDVMRHLKLLLEQRKAEIASVERCQNSLRLQTGAICLQLDVAPDSSVTFRRIAGDSSHYAALCHELITYMQTCQ